MMEDRIKDLIEDYKRKVETINDMIEENIPNLHTVIRLKAKKSSYRTFITNLEKLSTQID